MMIATNYFTLGLRMDLFIMFYLEPNDIPVFIHLTIIYFFLLIYFLFIIVP